MGIETVADLVRCRLLRSGWQRWTPWFQAAGVTLAEPVDSAPFDDAGLLLDAAIAGQGVALVRTVLARDALRDGKLVRLSDVEVPFEGAYYYVTPVGVARCPADAFGDWLAGALAAEF